MKNLSVESYPFPKSELLFSALRSIRKYRFKLYKAFRPHNKRVITRNILRNYLPPEGYGLELGCGDQTIAPVKRTILSDAHPSHIGNKSLAKVFFPAEVIPYENDSFSFVLSEHMLEHCHDPILVLKEIKRVLTQNGIIALVLPHKDRTFDKYRNRTSLADLIENNSNPHQRESFLQGIYSDWEKLVIAKGLASHYKDVPMNDAITNGLLHISVWLPEDVSDLVNFVGFKPLLVLNQLEDRPDSFLVIAKK